jgi:diacylglycerol kinase family enzyme
MNLEAAVRESLATGSKGIIAAGGDGTLNAVAGALRNSGVPMAILPIGTLNHLARNLGVPLDADQAIDALDRGRIQKIDLGEVNGSVFLNNSILGLYPEYEFAKEGSLRRGRQKWLAMASALINVFRRYPQMTVRLVTGGREIMRRTPYVLVANNEHRMEGYELGERDRLDEGVLWVYVMRRRTRWELLKIAVSLLFGRFRRRETFETFIVDRVRIETWEKRPGVALDGDVRRLTAPLAYRSLPGALHVVAPEQAPLKAPEAAPSAALVR